jgi:hypothetical protein
LQLDISYASSLLYQFNINPSSEYLCKANCVFRYLTYIQEYAIKYSLYDDDKNSFIAINDTSFTNDPVTRRSTQGYLFKLFNNSILWQSIQQQMVIISTIEAELLTLSAIAKEIIVIYRLFFQIKFNPGT